MCLHEQMPIQVPVALRVLWGVGMLMLMLVLGAVTTRWIGGGRLHPPSGWLALATGAASLIVGMRWRTVRPVAWGIGWVCLLHMAGGLIQLQLRLDRSLPVLYLGVWVALGLLAPACIWWNQLPADSASPPRDLV